MDIPADMTKGIRVIKYIAPYDGTWTVTISAVTYTTFKYDGKNSYASAGKTKTVELEVIGGETYVFEVTNTSSEYIFTQDICEEKEVPEGDGVSPDDDTQQSATVIDIKETPSFSSFVGEADPVDWFEITNFDAVRTTFTLSIEDGDSRVTAVIYSFAEGDSTMKSERSWSTLSSASSTLALANTRRYLIKLTSSRSSNYTMTITQ
jgi:hypothetical protein